MRPRRGALAALATLVLSLLAAGFAGSAAAGGPTSVLLVVPGEGRTTSLYTGSADYEELAKLVGAFDSRAGSTTPPEGAGDDGASGTSDASGPGVTLTWLIHAVSVWRVDRVYLKAKGGPWISTQTNRDGGDLWSKPATWRSADDGEALTLLLDRLGVGNAGTGMGSAAAAAAMALVTSASPASSAPPASSASSDRAGGLPGPDGWIWGPAGVLFGIALTLAVRWWLATRDGLPDDADQIEVDHDEVDENSRPRMETLASHSPGRR